GPTPTNRRLRVLAWVRSHPGSRSRAISSTSGWPTGCPGSRFLSNRTRGDCGREASPITPSGAFERQTMTRIVNTVTGPVPSDQLGVTLMHEHLCTGPEGILLDSRFEFNAMARMDLIVSRLSEFAQLLAQYGVTRQVLDEILTDNPARLFGGV